MNETTKILIVDDRQENLVAMEAALTSKNYELVTAQSGEEALKYVLKDEFAVILLDVQMPGLNGFDTAELIKKREKSKDTPIIFITAISKDFQHVSKGYQSGAVDYIFKPVNPYILKNKVMAFVNLYKSKNKVKREKKQFEKKSIKLKDSYDHLEALIAERTKDLQVVNNELEKSKEDFKKIFEFSPVSMAIRSLSNYRYTNVNKYWTELTGYEFRDLIENKKNMINIQSKTQENNHELPLDLTPGLLNEKVTYVTKTNEIREALLSTETVIINHEPCIISAITDVTEMRKYEKQISRLDQLNLVGEMAAGIAHEIRNPMTTVHGFLQLSKSDFGTEGSGDYINLMIDELSRANNIITEFLSLSKDPVIDKKMYDINAIIKKLFPLLQAEALMENKTIKINLEECLLLYVDEKEIKQLILNIGINGLEAMSSGGVLLIHTYMENQKVILKIIDEGPGINKEVLDKIGTPFFTTKQKGTGLGLAICYRIAANHSAEITIESSDKGTTFIIAFHT